MAITTTTSSMIVELNQMRVRMERMERELDASRQTLPPRPQTQSQSSARPRFKNNARFLPEILSQIVTNITSAILYVFGILYGSELSKSVHKLEIILILLIIFVTLIFIAHGIKQISTAATPQQDGNEKDDHQSSRPSKQRTPYSIGENASSSSPPPSVSTFATPFTQWKLFWQFASEIVAFLSQYVVFIFVGAIKDVLVDTSISGPWAEFILLRPLSFVAFLIFVKILIQYLHEGVKN